MDSKSHNNTQQRKILPVNADTDVIRLQGHFDLILNWYKVNSKSLSGEEKLTGLNIQTLLSILGNPIWNQLYHCWEVEVKHMTYLQPYVLHHFDPTKFIYFIEAYNTSQKQA